MANAVAKTGKGRSANEDPKNEAKKPRDKDQSGGGKRMRKLSEYGKQLMEKQRIKRMYGMREKPFKRFFRTATKLAGAPGENLLSLLERRLDNVVYRLKLSVTRRQARQTVVHGHVLVNGRKAYTPSYTVATGDVITLAPKVLKKEVFLEKAIDKRLKIGIKVPEWLELDVKERRGVVLRSPVRTDIQMKVEEHLIVELYSK